MEFYNSISSTNIVVKQALESGCEQGFCVVALQQTQGYGRQGRTWSSPVGGVYFSVALRPAVSLEQVASLALLCALAVRCGIMQLQLIRSESDLLIKWPNDVVTPCAPACDNPYAELHAAHGTALRTERKTETRTLLGHFRKVCGISCESIAGGVCVGVGMNVLRHADAKTDGRYTPGYISDNPGPCFEQLLGGSSAQGVPSECSARTIAQSITDSLLAFMPAWEENGFAPFRDAYNCCSYLANKHVAVANSQGAIQHEGVVRGVGDNGELLVETPQGTLEHVIAGEAHLV